jgi:hypothetical protein
MTVGAVLVALLCSWTGWMLLALTKHAHADLLGLDRAPCRPLAVLLMRIAAGLLAAASATFCVMQDGWSFGCLMWGCVTCVAALLATLTLTGLRSRG